MKSVGCQVDGRLPQSTGSVRVYEGSENNMLYKSLKEYISSLHFTINHVPYTNNNQTRDKILFGLESIYFIPKMFFFRKCNLNKLAKNITRT